MAKKKMPIIAAGAKTTAKRIKMPPRPDSPEQRLHDIVSTVGDWIWETNEILELTFISDRFLETTGLPPDTLHGKTLQQVVLSDDSAGPDNPVVFNLEHREPFSDIACSLVTSDHKVQHFTLSGIPYYSANNMFRGYRGAAHNITQQLETQRQLHKIKRSSIAEISPSQAIDQSTDATPKEAFVIYDQNGDLIAASEGYAELYPALDDVIIPGAALRDILTQAAERLKIKEAQGRLEEWVEEKLAQRLSPSNRQQEIYRGGRWWRIHEQRTREGQVLSLHTDITAIKDMESSLLDAESRYRRLVEMAPDLTCVVSSGVITLMNTAGSELLKGNAPDDFIGKRFEDYMHPDFRGLVRDNIEALIDEAWTPLRLLRCDGQTIDAELVALPFSERGFKTVMLVARDTSERRRAAQALITREEHLQGIMETVVDGIITIDDHGIIHTFNRAAEKIFGYLAHEVVDHNISNLMPEPYASQHDGYMSKFCKTREKNIIGKGREVQGLRKNGKVFPLDLAVSEMRRDGKSLFIGVVRDITGRKKAEMELKESRERFQLAINGAGEGIWDWNVQNDELYISSKLCEMTGYKSQFIKPSSWLKLIHPQDRKAYRANLISHLKGETPHFTAECRLNMRRRKSDAAECWILISGMAMRDKAGWAYRMAGSVGDITHKMEFESEIIAAKERAEIANRVKSEFLANMSHELRTPLNAIIGFSDVMISKLFGELAPRYEEYVENIRDSGTHLLSVINDILDVSRIEAGRMTLYPERIKAEEIIESAMRLINDRAHEAGLSMSRRVDKDLPDLMLDNQRIKQVMLNILSNAVKFTPKGGKITVKASKNRAGDVVLSVTDSGIGMSAEEIEVAMVPFGQVDSKLARRYDGTGLGLPLTKSFVELHDCQLRISSEVGKGTKVSVHIPAERQVD